MATNHGPATQAQTQQQASRLLLFLDVLGLAPLPNSIPYLL
jgi:hypothetical protein